MTQMDVNAYKLGREVFLCYLFIFIYARWLDLYKAMTVLCLALGLNNNEEILDPYIIDEIGK